MTKKDVPVVVAGVMKIEEMTRQLRNVRIQGTAIAATVQSEIKRTTLTQKSERSVRHLRQKRRALGHDPEDVVAADADADARKIKRLPSIRKMTIRC